MYSPGILTQVRLLPIEEKHFHQDRYFPLPDEAQINSIVKSKQPIHIQKLLKYVHTKYYDQGLRTTLIHKLFYCKSNEIAYYVPQLVYIAIKKDSKHLKRLLLNHAQHNNSLRRLILWNVKAFTVMIKQKSREVKKKIEEFQEALSSTVPDKNLFTQSLKAIAMLTEASLTLKKLPKQKQKQKLSRFIKRFNIKYLNNIDHRILIPFRHSAHQKYQSDYVVGLIQEQCSCFPTRKRVPYRIIIQTIDVRQLEVKRPDQRLFHAQRLENQSQKDLYSQVSESVDKLFQMLFLNMPTDNNKLFAVDTEQSRKFSQMKTYFKSIQKKQQQQKQSYMDRSIGGRSRKGTFGAGLMSSQHKFKTVDLKKYKIEPSQNLSKFEAIYIPDIRQNHRRSDQPELKMTRSHVIQNCLEDSRKRKSDKFVQEQVKHVKIYEENVKQIDEAIQQFFGKPWKEKKDYYKSKSYFQHFDSLTMRNVVVKGGDDLRQQIICMQLIYKMKEIISEAKLPIFIKPYEIIVLSQNSGILQFVSNSISIDSMKKKCQENNISIFDFYCDIFKTQEKLERATENFVNSLVGSSIMTFVLKLKDRHNGNILLDKDGHIIHIDFGFILGMSPGNINFQKSPFKFTSEYLQVLGGRQSVLYTKFTDLFYKGMKALRDRADQLSLVLQIMMEDSDLDCFKHFDLKLFMNQFKRHYSQQRFKQYCQNLVQQSCENRYSIYYDNFQQFSNGILP